MTLSSTKTLLAVATIPIQFGGGLRCEGKPAGEFRHMHDPDRARSYEFGGDFWKVEYDFVLDLIGE
jgi:hypothetical protein